MDEQKDCNNTGIYLHQHSLIMKEVEEQYQSMNSERFRIHEELDQQKAHERQIKYKLWYFTYLDNQIKGKMWKIKCLECNMGKVKPTLPTKFIPRTTDYYCLNGKGAQTPVRSDQKRCQKRLIKKGRMDIKYLDEVQEEHISLMKPGNYMPYCGTRELKDMMESMVQRIKHGNKKRADEMKILQELSKFKKTEKSYIEPKPLRNRERRSKWDIDQMRSMQHKINIRLDDIEKLKGEQIGRIARVRRLKAELEHVRKTISYLNKKLENVDSTILKANVPTSLEKLNGPEANESKATWIE